MLNRFIDPDIWEKATGNEFLKRQEQAHNLPIGIIWKGMDGVEEPWGTICKACKPLSEFERTAEAEAEFAQKWAPHMHAVDLVTSSDGKVQMILREAPTTPRAIYLRKEKKPDSVVSNDVEKEMRLVCAAPTMHMYSAAILLQCTVGELMLQLPETLWKESTKPLYYDTYFISGSLMDGSHRCITLVFEKREDS